MLLPNGAWSDLMEEVLQSFDGGLRIRELGLLGSAGERGGDG